MGERRQGARRGRRLLGGHRRDDDLVDLQEHLPLFLEITDRCIPRTAVPPAWTAIGITELTFPKQLVEIKVVALIP